MLKSLTGFDLLFHTSYYKKYHESKNKKTGFWKYESTKEKLPEHNFRKPARNTYRFRKRQIFNRISEFSQ